MPGPIHISIQYDKLLQQITKVQEMPMTTGENSPFVFLLYCVLTDYPEIKEKYPPGILAFSVNGIAPETDSVLHDGDKVWFGVA